MTSRLRRHAGKFGLRRQSEAATALSSVRPVLESQSTPARAKAVSRCACHRSPNGASSGWIIVLPVCNWQGLMTPERARQFTSSPHGARRTCQFQTGSTL